MTDNPIYLLCVPKNEKNTNKSCILCLSLNFQCEILFFSAFIEEWNNMFDMKSHAKYEPCLTIFCQNFIQNHQAFYADNCAEPLETL